MKEPYYSDILINQQAQVFLEKLIPLRKKHNSRIKPKEVALLILDFQRFFFDNSSHAFIPSASAILPRVLKLQNYYLQKGIKVIQTRHVNTKENSQMMLKWWSDNLPSHVDPLAQLISEIVNPACTIIDKSQYDAFYGTKLDAILRSSGITQLIITGVMTHLCCETTARSAFTHGYEVFFSIDGTATYNREFHLGSLINLAHGFAVPMLVEEIMEQVGI